MCAVMLLLQLPCARPPHTAARGHRLRVQSLRCRVGAGLALQARAGPRAESVAKDGRNVASEETDCEASKACLAVWLTVGRAQAEALAASMVCSPLRCGRSQAREARLLQQSARRDACC